MIYFGVAKIPILTEILDLNFELFSKIQRRIQIQNNRYFSNSKWPLFAIDPNLDNLKLERLTFEC
jgi:lipase chaperone LimK